MSREQQLLVRDVLDAYRKCIEWTDTLAFEAFAQRGVVYSAVLRELSVAGEAIKQLTEETRGRAPEVPWRELAGLRDVVIHQYFGLQDATLWNILREELPPIRESLDAMLAGWGDG